MRHLVRQRRAEVTDALFFSIFSLMLTVTAPAEIALSHEQEQFWERDTMEEGILSTVCEGWNTYCG
jgi:hypothetical protein